jgi:amino acid transporter
MQQARPLLAILGLSFCLALAFGSTVGVGILRLPGTVAAALGDPTLIMLMWFVGGLYALMGAVAVAELAAMIPETGGFRVYARRAFGEGVGFAVGWVDWLSNVAALAYVAITAVTFLGTLWPAATYYPRAAAIACGFRSTASAARSAWCCCGSYSSTRTVSNDEVRWWRFASRTDLTSWDSAVAVNGCCSRRWPRSSSPRRRISSSV